MEALLLEEPYVLQQDGCWVDNQGIQHYLFPRELIEVEDSIELARNEAVWHLHPEWQGQYEEDKEVEQDWDAIQAEVEKLAESEVTFQLFPREIFAEYMNEDWDAIAYLEWRWYSRQTNHLKE